MNENIGTIVSEVRKKRGNGMANKKLLKYMTGHAYTMR